MYQTIKSLIMIYFSKISLKKLVVSVSGSTESAGNLHQSGRTLSKYKGIQFVIG